MKKIAKFEKVSFENFRAAFADEFPECSDIQSIYDNINGEFVAFFVRGDRELNENKVSKLFGVKEINFANDELIATSNAVPGYTGPIGLNCKVVVDKEILGIKNFCCGANKEGYHYINANVSDIKYDMVADIANVVSGDHCPMCDGSLYFKKGIEVGNLFKLGTKYAEKLNLTYLDENNKECITTMGCYGIGVGRILAAVIEQHNDENGIVWPLSVAPYHVSVIPVNIKDEEQMKIAEKLYEELLALGVEALLDDRNERAGVKFKDSELMGIPMRVTVGKKITDGEVEFKLREGGENETIKIEEVIGKVKQVFEKNNIKIK